MYKVKKTNKEFLCNWVFSAFMFFQSDFAIFSDIPKVYSVLLWNSFEKATGIMPPSVAVIEHHHEQLAEERLYFSLHFHITVHHREGGAGTCSRSWWWACGGAWLAVLPLMAYLACIFIAPMNASPGVVPPTVAGPSHIINQENVLQICLQSNLIEASPYFFFFPVESPFSS